MLKLEKDVFDGIIDLLLPYVESEPNRKSLLMPHLMNHPNLLSRIEWAGSPKDFSVALVNLLWKQGEIETDKQCLVLLLDILNILAGKGDQERIVQLIETIDQAEELPPGTDNWPPDKPAATGGSTTTIDTGGGAFIGGSVSVGGNFHARDTITHNRIVQGDEIAGDKVGGDKITVGDISGSTGIAIGRNAQATVTAGIANEDFSTLFQPLLEMIRSNATDSQPEALQKAHQLQQEVAKGEQADDEKTADLIDELIDLVPYAVSGVKACFSASPISGLIGPATEYMLRRIQRRS